jgi:hypothetical protein
MQFLPIRKVNKQLSLYKERIAVHCENRMKHTNTQCEKTEDFFLMLKQFVYMLTNLLKRVKLGAYLFKCECQQQKAFLPRGFSVFHILVGRVSAMHHATKTDGEWRNGTTHS